MWIAKQEAKKYFSDDSVYIEKYFENPRHIEVQILSDKKTTIHLGERDCSVQRKHQKLIEESPSPVLEEKVRQDLLDKTVKMVSKLDYEGAGTVEFIYDKGKFFFLEMNTRIQVEHPVSEIQKYTHELLSEKAGSISVMDIYSGEIIAMNSSPSFNPNLFLYGIEKNKWKEIQKDPLKPLINKTVSGLYSPGSTIKPLVALSALENDVISVNMKVNCRGHKHPLELYGMKYHCWKKEGHGYMTLRNAIKQSCDTYFYEAARLLGVDRLNKTAKNLV